MYMFITSCLVLNKQYYTLAALRDSALPRDRFSSGRFVSKPLLRTLLQCLDYQSKSRTFYIVNNCRRLHVMTRLFPTSLLWSRMSHLQQWLALAHIINSSRSLVIDCLGSLTGVRTMYAPAVTGSRTIALLEKLGTWIRFIYTSSIATRSQPHIEIAW